MAPLLVTYPPNAIPTTSKASSTENEPMSSRTKTKTRTSCDDANKHNKQNTRHHQNHSFKMAEDPYVSVCTNDGCGCANTTTDLDNVSGCKGEFHSLNSFSFAEILFMKFPIPGKNKNERPSLSSSHEN